MKEFMTKVSDYISERRNDPENSGGIAILYILGVVIFIIVIVCLLLLWRKDVHEKKQEVKTETYEETMETVLAGASEEDALRQQYLTNIEYLEERVEELLASMTEIKETMEETVVMQEAADSGLQEQIDGIIRSINGLLIQLQQTQSQLYDLTDVVNNLEKKTLQMIQEGFDGVEAQMKEVYANISDLYEKIAALETTDRELQAKLKKVENFLKVTIEQNMEEIMNRFADISIQMQIVESQIEDTQTQIDDMEKQIGNTQTQVGDTQTQIANMQEQIEQMQKQIENMSLWIQNREGQLLHYRYDEDTNTLHLMPDQE